MSFGTTVKALRRERDMTQEELAEVLSISPQAVSRWETDAAMPDISLLPAICNLFDVTSDHLLGIDVVNKKKQIDEVLQKADVLSSKGYVTEALEILDEALKKNPNDFRLMQSIMYDESFLEDNESDPENKRSHRDRAVMLGEKILESCTDDGIRNGATQVLCYKYAQNGKLDKARELTQKLPYICNSYECTSAIIETGDKRYEARMCVKFNLFQFLLETLLFPNTELDSGDMAYTKEEETVLINKGITLIELLYEKGDYGFMNDRLQSAHTELARTYADTYDKEKTLVHLGNAAEAAIAFIDFSKAAEYKHTSLFFRGRDGGSFTAGNSDNNASDMLKDMKDSRFDFIRDDPEFTSIENRLTEYAGKWTV